MTPSSPCALACSNSAGPSSNATESRIASPAISVSARSSLRSERGRPVTSRPSSMSRSKAYIASAPPPCWSSEKRGRPASSSAHTSPSSTQSALRRAPGSARATWAKRAVRSLPFRLRRVASPPSIAAIPVAVPLHLVHPVPVRGEVGRGDGQHRPQLGGVARQVALVLAHDQPVLLVAVHTGRDQRPEAVQALAAQAHRQAAVALLLDRLVVAAVPDLDRPAAVLALRDLALEVRVVERVVLDVHGQVALALAQRDALGDGPARERAVALDAEVEVQAAGVVALDDEDRLVAPAR